MRNVAAGPDIPISKLEWKPCWRLIHSRHPAIDFFERIARPEDWEVLIQLEQRTNPRVLEEMGKIQLIRPEDRQTGPGWGWVNAAFTHISEAGSRFSDGSYGIYYAGKTIDTVIAEVTFHQTLFYSRTPTPRMQVTMSLIKANLKGHLHDLRNLHKQHPEWFDPDITRYSEPQRLAKQLYQQDSYGIVYLSVRDVGGECAAVFRPPVLDEPVHDRYLNFLWDGHQLNISDDDLS